MCKVILSNWVKFYIVIELIYNSSSNIRHRIYGRNASSMKIIRIFHSRVRRINKRVKGDTSKNILLTEI